MDKVFGVEIVVTVTGKESGEVHSIDSSADFELDLSELAQYDEIVGKVIHEAVRKFRARLIAQDTATPTA